MKKYTFIFTLFSVIYFSGCASTGVIPLGNNSFSIGKKDGMPGVGISYTVRADVYKEANEFCTKKNLQVETVSVSTIPAVPGRLGSTDLIFKCINSSSLITKNNSNDTVDKEIETLLSKYQPSKVDNKKWLFIVAIENYDDTDNVKYAKHSANMFKQVAQRTLGISDRNTYSLINEKATSGRIKDRLQMFLAEVKQGDKVYFYYSGHGIPDPSNNGEPYILPSDKLPAYINQDNFFSLKNIYTLLNNSQALEIIAFVDSCFSGATDGKSILKGVAATRLKAKNLTIDKEKMTVITAGSGTEFSNMYEEKNHRLFSYYLMKSLLNGDTNVYTIYKKVSSNVYNQSNIMGPLYRQEPVLKGSRNFEL